MATRKSPSLSAVYQAVRARADRAAVADPARRGTAFVDLGSGARITVRVLILDDLRRDVLVSFSRPGAPVGDVELATFRGHCSIPDGAHRIPAEGQRKAPDGGRERYLVGYTWIEA